MIANRMQTIDSSGIRRVFDLTNKLKDPINLSIGQPDFDVPDPIKNAAISAIQDGYNGYTQTGGIPELRDKLKVKLEADRQKSYEDLIITSGVSGGLFLAFLTLINPGDEVLIPDPYFVSYKQLVHFVGGKTIFVDTYPDFSITKDRIEQAITPQSKILLLNSPNNPTGQVIPKTELIEIAQLAQKHNLIIVSDEIYDLFVYDETFHSISTYHPQTLLLSGFSKTFGMPGWRVGYAAGPKEIIQEMMKIQQYTYVCAPYPAQKALLNSLDHDVSDEISNYKGKRDIVCGGLKSDFDIQVPGGAFYVFPRVPHGDDQSFVEEAIANNVLIIPGSVFSERSTHFRISFATSDERLKKGIDILNHI